MQAPAIETIIFDLDGTLIDTELAAAQAIRECFKSWGIDVLAEDAAYITGRTWAAAFGYLFKKYQIPVPHEEAADLMMKHYRGALETGLIVVPGSVAAVRSLAGAFPLGLVSGSNRAEILFALRKLGIDSHFQVILGAEDYPRSKPEPDGYLKAISIMKADPARCLIFEDSNAGIASARKSGAWVIAVTGTNHFKQDTSAAHHHIEDLKGVNADWVLNWNPLKPVPS